MESDCTSSNKLTIDNVRENIVGINTKVPTLDGAIRTYVNLDNAASTPAMKPVFEKVTEFMNWYSSVHRGSGFKSQVSTHIYDEAHEIACAFVKAEPDKNVAIFGKNASESLNKLARRIPFKSGDVVLTTMMEHHSNDLPWRQAAEVDHIQVDKLGALDMDHLESLVKKYAGKLRLIVVAGATNVTGYLNPIYEIAEIAHNAGAEIVVDAAQMAPHRALDVKPNDDPQHIDYVVVAGHKMYAPYGCSALIGKRSTFLQGDPDLVGGGTVSIVTVDDVRWAGLPDKEEAGSPNVVGAVAQAKTMLSLQEIGMDNVARHEAELTAYTLTKLNKMEKVRLFGMTDPARAHERVGVITLQVEGISHYKVAAILSAEGAIGVRNGCFCAHPYLFKLLDLSPEESKHYQKMVIDNNRKELPGLVRVSFGCYNNSEDIDRLIEMLSRIIHNDYEGNYIQDETSGDYWPQGFAVETKKYFTL